MRIAETSEFLARVGLGDNRRPSEAVLMMWHELLEPHTLADCLWALKRHRAESAEYLMPAHILTRVKARERDRLTAVPAEANPDIEADYPAACRALSAAVKTGLMGAADYRQYLAGNVPAAAFVDQLRRRGHALTSDGRARGELSG